VASGDFNRIFNWAWPAAFGSPHFFSTVGQYCGAAYHPINGITDTSFAVVNDYEYCNYWIQIGSGDGFSSHLHLPGSAKRMADARMRGMRVVTVEPRMSPAPAAAKADEWVPIRPGTDRAFALGLMHSIVFEHELYDREFLKLRTNAPYLIGPDGTYALSADGKAMVGDPVAGKAREWDDPEIAEFALEGRYDVNGVSCAPGFQLFRDIIADHTPERMEEICTVPAATMRRLAKELGEAARIGETIMLEGKEYPFRPAAVNYYRGAIAHKDGGQDLMALKMLNTLLGNIDMPGGHLGVPLDLRGFFIEPGEHGILKPNPHILHPPVSFKFDRAKASSVEPAPISRTSARRICRSPTLCRRVRWCQSARPQSRSAVPGGLLDQSLACSRPEPDGRQYVRASTMPLAARNHHPLYPRLSEVRNHACRHPTRGQEQRVPGGHHAVRCARAGA